jgi:hypothetical protein
MFRSNIRQVALFAVLSLAALAGCTGGSDDEENNTPAPAEESSKTPAKSSGDSDNTDTEKSSAGPECTAYLACCDEIAAEQPALAGSCDTTRSTIDDAVGKGASTDSYESACKQALSSMKGAGYCK